MISLIRPVLLIAMAALGAAGSALAQTPAPSAPPAGVDAPLVVPTVPAPVPVTAPPSAQQQIEIKDEHLQAARELITVSRTLDAFEGLLPNILQQVGLTLTSQNLTLQADQRKRSVLIESLKAIEESFAPEREKLYTQIALIYAARFTEAELRKIVEFLKSVEGQKFATVSPLVAQDSFRIANSWAERIGQEAFERVRAEMRRRGQPL